MTAEFEPRFRDGFYVEITLQTITELRRLLSDNFLFVKTQNPPPLGAHVVVVIDLVGDTYPLDAFVVHRTEEPHREVAGVGLSLGAFEPSLLSTAEC